VQGGEASDESAAEAGVMSNAFTHVLPRLQSPRSPSPGVKLELTTGWCCMWRLSALTSLGVVGIHGELIWAVPECGVCVRVCVSVCVCVCVCVVRKRVRAQSRVCDAVCKQ
jgi:hypothetical protein